MTGIGVGACAAAQAVLSANAGLVLHPKHFNLYSLTCRDRFGNIKWQETIRNLVTTEGENSLLSVYFKSGTQITSWYVGLISGSSPTLVAGDTAAQIGGTNGWTEFTSYSETVRQTLTLGSVASGSVDNSASKAAFSINGSGTIGGAFVVSNSTKSGTSGTLYGEAALSSARTVADGDTLNMQATLSFS